MKLATYITLAMIFFRCSLQSKSVTSIIHDSFEPIVHDVLTVRTGLMSCVARCLDLSEGTPQATVQSPCSCSYNVSDDKEIKFGSLAEAVKLKTGCYLFLEESLEWRSAVELCGSRGFRLLSLETQRETDVVVEHLTAQQDSDVNPRVWTSGLMVYTSPEDRYKWVSTGCEIDSVTWSHEPDLQTKERCVVFEDEGDKPGLAETACDDILGVVCEWIPKDEMVTLSTGEYLIIDGQMTWKEGMENCTSRGLQLVSIETAVELEAISEHITKIKGSCSYYIWTSGRYIKSRPHTWTATGLRFKGVTWWHENQPEFGKNLVTENCIALQRYRDYFEPVFLLNDLNCYTRLNVICEKQ